MYQTRVLLGGADTYEFDGGFTARAKGAPLTNRASYEGSERTKNCRERGFTGHHKPHVLPLACSARGYIEMVRH